VGKPVPSWRTFISCAGRSVTIRHQKEGLAEDLEIPWPKRLDLFTCEKVRFRPGDLEPLLAHEKTLHTVDLQGCRFDPGALDPLAKLSHLRCLSLRDCALSDEALNWFRGGDSLEVLNLGGNPGCTGRVIRQAEGSPLGNLSLEGTGIQNGDMAALAAFPHLETLSVSGTAVTGEGLLSLAGNLGLTVLCDHDREGLARFRAAQRQGWKKTPGPTDDPVCREAMELVRAFFAASQDPRRERSGFVTQGYLDYCKAHGFNGVDPEQRVAFRDSREPPYKDCRGVDAERLTGKKVLVYWEKDDRQLSQYRCLAVRTPEGWRLDKNEWLCFGKWQFYPLE